MTGKGLSVISYSSSALNTSLWCLWGKVGVCSNCNYSIITGHTKEKHMQRSTVYLLFFYLSYTFFACFSTAVSQLWAPPSALHCLSFTSERRMRIFLPLHCVDPAFQLELLPSQKLFLTATSVKLSCRAASTIDFVFSLKSVCVSCGGKIYAAHYTILKVWVYEHVHVNSFCLHSNGASLVFLHTNESWGFQTSETQIKSQIASKCN